MWLCNVFVLKKRSKTKPGDKTDKWIYAWESSESQNQNICIRFVFVICRAQQLHHIHGNKTIFIWAKEKKHTGKSLKLSNETSRAFVLFARAKKWKKKKYENSWSINSLCQLKSHNQLTSVCVIQPAQTRKQNTNAHAVVAVVNITCLLLRFLHVDFFFFVRFFFLLVHFSLTRWFPFWASHNRRVDVVCTFIYCYSLS